MSPVFDPREVDCEPLTSVVDEGTYLVEIERATSKQDNFGLKVRVFYKIISPENYRDSFLMDNFNLEHGKENVAEIGKQQFKRLLQCIGMGNSALNHYSDIVGKQLKLDVGIEPHYKDLSATQNKIKKHMSINAIDINLLKVPLKKSQDSDVPF